MSRVAIIVLTVSFIEAIHQCDEKTATNHVKVVLSDRFDRHKLISM